MVPHRVEGGVFTVNLPRVNAALPYGTDIVPVFASVPMHITSIKYYLGT